MTDAIEEVKKLKHEHKTATDTLDSAHEYLNKLNVPVGRLLFRLRWMEKRIEQKEKAVKK
jgi:hypothetical protein